jgi:hypothetical protein
MGALSRGYRRTKKAVKRRYGLNKKSKMPNYARMVSDVAKVVKMVNAEKKSIEYGFSTVVGQVQGSNSGHYVADVTPLMAQGTDAFTRNGNSVKVVSSFFQFQITQQSALTVAQKLIIELWFHPGTVVSTTNAGLQLFDYSVWSNVIDTNSSRTQNYMSQYKLIAKKYVTLPADSISGDVVQKTLTMPIKYFKGKGFHIKYTGSNASNYLTDIQNNQLIMTVRADYGNCSTATVSTSTTIPQTAVNTGVRFSYGWKHYFYDN